MFLIKGSHKSDFLTLSLFQSVIHRYNVTMTESVPLKQNENVSEIFMPVLQEKRNISVKQYKVSTWVLLYASCQSDFP